VAVIGIFARAKDGGWVGRVKTLTIDAKVRFVPNDNRNSENAPAFQVCVGKSRIGDAWAARSNSENPKDYLRVRFDDPSLLEPISAALFATDEGKEAQLVWSRRKDAE
jgi:uncharacterized protein (DUF736 family)